MATVWNRDVIPTSYYVFSKCLELEGKQLKFHCLSFNSPEICWVGADQVSGHEHKQVKARSESKVWTVKIPENVPYKVSSASIQRITPPINFAQLSADDPNLRCFITPF